jgi:hypothetical protein
MSAIVYNIADARIRKIIRKPLRFVPKGAEDWLKDGVEVKIKHGSIIFDSEGHAQPAPFCGKTGILTIQPGFFDRDGYLVTFKEPERNTFTWTYERDCLERP